MNELEIRPTLSDRTALAENVHTNTTHAFHGKGDIELIHGFKALFLRVVQ